jgi:hypothetical protein
MKQEFNKRVGRPLALTHGLTIKQGSDRFDSNSHGRSAAESGAEDLPDSRVLTRAQMNARNGKKPNPAGVRKPTPRKGKTIVLGGKGAVESRLSNDTQINLGGRKNSRDAAMGPSTLTGGHSRASEPAIVSGPRGGDGYVN